MQITCTVDFGANIGEIPVPCLRHMMLKATCFLVPYF